MARLSTLLKNTNILLVVVSCTMLFYLGSCKHELVYPQPDEETPGNGDTIVIGGGIPCDPDSVYFNEQILPILASNCAFSGCHDAASHQDGVILDNYTNTMNTGDVRPFNLSGSDLYEVITENDPDKKMPPPPRTALSSAQISLIANWINQGALNISCSSACDTNNVTFSGTIRPILQNKCIGCHSGSAPGGGINLSAYSGVYPVAVNGKLHGAVSHSAGSIAMPQNAAKLPDCEINKIGIWVNAGAPNN